MQVENISWKVGKRNRLGRSKMSFKVNTKSKPKKKKRKSRSLQRLNRERQGTGDPMLQEHRVTTR